MQRSGAQSESCAQAFLHEPLTAPLQVCAPPQSSPVTQPQTPALHLPPEQSASVVHANVWHEPPPQKLPAPQSLFVAHALALHVAPLHKPSGH